MSATGVDTLAKGVDIKRLERERIYDTMNVNMLGDSVDMIRVMTVRRYEFVDLRCCVCTIKKRSKALCNGVPKR